MERRKKKIGLQISSELAHAHGVSADSVRSAERLLSPNEIGKILNVTGEAVKRWIYYQRLPAVKLSNGYWKVKVADLENFLRTRQETAKRPVLIPDSLNGAMQQVIQVVDGVGCRPLVARNFPDALLKTFEYLPVLFIIHLGIDNLEPWKLVEKIRTTKELRKAPILLMADKEITETDADRATNLAAQGFIKLPVDKATLAREIEQLLNNAQ